MPALTRPPASGFVRPSGRLPARFRRARVLLVGCGDVGLRAAALLQPRVRLLALTSSAERRPDLRARGITPLLGDLDQASTVKRLSGLASRVLHLAPPQAQGDRDARSQALLRALALRSAPKSLVYGSTTGVYGDCRGEWVDEMRALRPQSTRAQRRAWAEAAVRLFGRQSLTRVSVLRIPGIYAPDRAGGTPRERLLKGTPVLRAEDDVYTNHVHADDLARACVAALWRGRPQRVYNCNDDGVFKMGDYFDLAADLYGLPRPERISREQAQAQLAPMLLSFMSESRRLRNDRIKRELGLSWRYPTVRSGLRS